MSSYLPGHVHLAIYNSYLNATAEDGKTIWNGALDIWNNLFVRNIAFYGLIFGVRIGFAIKESGSAA